MITVVEEPAEISWGTLCHLFHAHGREVVGRTFNLNLVLFSDAIKCGNLRFFIARDEQAEAIGYACFNVYRDGMRAHEMVADCQAIYVMPKYRGRISVRLIKVAERALKADGIRRIYMHIPAKTPSVANMLVKPKMGYSPLEFTLEKEL